MNMMKIGAIVYKAVLLTFMFMLVSNLIEGLSFVQDLLTILLYYLGLFGIGFSEVQGEEVR